MTPTRRKPTKRKVTDKSIGTPADALSVDELRPDERTAGGQGAFGVGETPAPAPDASPRERAGESAACEVRRRFLGPLQITLIIILVVLLVIEGGFCLMRWGVDDAADVQGAWYVNGSDETIVITAESIVLADDVAYVYAIDEGAKTMTYEFGIMEGAGRYRFSLDRSQLAIIDGTFSFMDTLMADISWTFEALVAQVSGEPLAPGAGEGVALLERAPAATGGASGGASGDAEGSEGPEGAEGDQAQDPDGAADEAEGGDEPAGGDGSAAADDPAAQDASQGEGGSDEGGLASASDGPASGNPADAFDVSDVAHDA